MSDTSSRRHFLRGHLAPATPALRPPWALAEDQFTSLCTRCGDCLAACPTHILRAGSGGFPVVDFAQGECTFCGDCVAACRPAALHRDTDTPPWQIVATISAACIANAGVECRVCGEQCSEDAIRFRPAPGGIAHPQLDPAQCTGCGACIAPCPTQAISAVWR